MFGLHFLIPSRMYGKRCRGSSTPCLLPALEKGWHGNPAERRSTCPKNFSYGKVLRSVQIGAGGICPVSILSTKFSMGNLSRSQNKIGLRGMPSRSIPIPIPSYPVHRLMYRRAVSSVVFLVLLALFILFSSYCLNFQYSFEINLTISIAFSCSSTLQHL